MSVIWARVKLVHWPCRERRRVVEGQPACNCPAGGRFHMKAALCKSLDGPAGLVIEDIAAPQPGPGEALIAVKAAALNFFDTLITRGKYQAKPELPFSPSAEVAGVVEALGPGVAGVQAGDRVMAYLGWGGAREKVVAPADGAGADPGGRERCGRRRGERDLRHGDPWPQGPRRGSRPARRWPCSARRAAPGWRRSRSPS